MNLDTEGSLLNFDADELMASLYASSSLSSPRSDDDSASEQNARKLERCEI